MSLSQLDKLRNITRFSALRQAVILTACFLVLLLLAGLVSVFAFQSEFEDRIEEELQSRFTVVAADMRERGFVAASYPRTEVEHIRLLDNDSKIAPGFHDDLGFRGRGGDDDRGFGRGQWTYLVGPVGDDMLAVGTNLGRRDEFVELILQSMLMVGLGAAVLALVVGLWLGLRTQARMTAISHTLSAAAAGDLTARVGATHRRDDMDELAHQVDDTIRQLDVLIRQTRDFSANIAHDLKTPLSRLRIRLEKALTAEQGEGDSAEDIGAALEQADGIIAIFDAFLRIARLEAGTAQAKFAPVDLGELVTQVADTYEPVVADGGRSLTVSRDVPATVQGDPVLLTQLLANLIENAIRHTPPGTALTLFADGRTLGLRDTGPGIPEEEYARITQPLYRLDKSRSQDGVGLGLALVKTIAEAHGARLRFAAHPTKAGRGLSVSAAFPRKG